MASAVNRYQRCFIETNNTGLMWEGLYRNDIMLQVYLRFWTFDMDPYLISFYHFSCSGFSHSCLFVFIIIQPFGILRSDWSVATFWCQMISTIYIFCCHGNWFRMLWILNSQRLIIIKQTRSYLGCDQPVRVYYAIMKCTLFLPL